MTIGTRCQLADDFRRHPRSHSELGRRHRRNFTVSRTPHEPRNSVPDRAGLSRRECPASRTRPPSCGQGPIISLLRPALRSSPTAFGPATRWQRMAIGATKAVTLSKISVTLKICLLRVRCARSRFPPRTRSAHVRNISSSKIVRAMRPSHEGRGSSARLRRYRRPTGGRRQRRLTSGETKKVPDRHFFLVVLAVLDSPEKPLVRRRPAVWESGGSETRCAFGSNRAIFQLRQQLVASGSRSTFSRKSCPV